MEKDRIYDLWMDVDMAEGDLKSLEERLLKKEKQLNKAKNELNALVLKRSLDAKFPVGEHTISSGDEVFAFSIENSVQGKRVVNFRRVLFKEID